MGPRRLRGSAQAGRAADLSTAGVEIIEVSLVQWPAYERAGITSLSVRSAADQQRHEQSERTILEMRQFTAQVAARRAERRAR